MSRLVLVRHAVAASAWGAHPDPGLDPLGVRQAEALAASLPAAVGSAALVSSPMRRCLDTAAPLAARWGVEPTVVAAVGEIPTPHGVPLAERSAWLAEAMAGSWADLSEHSAAWRRGALDALAELAASTPSTTVVVTHFVAINVALGAALGDDRVLIARVGNATCTTLRADGGRFEVVEVGAEAGSAVL